MRTLITHLGAGVLGAGLALIGASIYIKKYHVTRNNIQSLCLKCKTQRTSNSIIPPLDTDYRAGKYRIIPMNLLENKDLKALVQYSQNNTLDLGAYPLYILNGTQDMPENLDLPVLHDFEKLKANVQYVETALDAENALQHSNLYPAELEDNSAQTVPPNLGETTEDSQKNNTILVLANMKANL